jgi:uncharacterized protein (DUF2147 family)
MMKKLLTTFLVVMIAMASYAQKADDICGIFHSVDPFSKEGSQCEIYKAADGTYEAKVVWVENPKKKNQLGLVFMTKLVYDPEAKEYRKGKLKYPGKSGTYSTYIRMSSDKNTLHMRGYLGASFLGKTVDWHRESKVRVQK